jgi:hypothetical protein
MQSSTAIAFRALIMLIFLISVPLIAIFGKDLPEVLKGLLDGRFSVHVTDQSKGGGPAGGSAPQPLAAGATSGTAAAPPANNPFAEAAPYRATAEPAASPTGTAVAPSAPPATPPLIQPGSNLPDHFTSAAEPGTAPSQVLNAGMTGPAGVEPSANWPNPSRPEAFQPSPDSRPIHSAELGRTGSAPEGTTPNANAADEGGDNKFRKVEMRLRELGATQYMLESWGASNEQYRFECRMAVGGNVVVTLHFKAIESNHWRAMVILLGQVEQWQHLSDR